jgi:hypothetical protein
MGAAAAAAQPLPAVVTILQFDSLRHQRLRHSGRTQAHTRPALHFSILPDSQPVPAAPLAAAATAVPLMLQPHNPSSEATGRSVQWELQVQGGTSVA